MSVSALTDRLQGVRRTGQGRWIARCPAHEDRRASLSIRELDDGRTLVHCFAGCETGEVLAASGVDISELFPPRAIDQPRRISAAERFPAADVLRALACELEVVLIIAGDIERKREVPAEDFGRLRVAAGRIRAALELALEH
jgi:hypothetical protein